MSLSNDSYAPYPVKTWPTRATGVGIAVFCLLMMLSLLSYDISEMGWKFLNPEGGEKAAQAPCTNLLGPIGLYMAGLLYSLLGVTALYGFLLAGTIGVCMILHPAIRRTSQWIALSIMIISACTFLAIQPWVFEVWAGIRCLSTPGGSIGYLMGSCVAEPLFGPQVSMIAALLIHAIALIYLCRETPSGVCSAAWADVCNLYQTFRERRRRKKEERRYEQSQWKNEIPSSPERQTAASPLSPGTLPPSRQTPPSPLPTASRTTPPIAQPKPIPGVSPSGIDTSAQAPLPPRQRTTIRPDSQPLSENKRTAETPQPLSSLPKRPADPVSPPREPLSQRFHSKGDNLLDLLIPVEEEIERESDRVFGTDAMPQDLPLNSHLQAAVKRHFGTTDIPENTRTPHPPLPQKRVPEQPSPRIMEEEAGDQKGDYCLPPLDLLEYKPVPAEQDEAAQAEKERMQNLIIDTLETFKISVDPGPITRGPSFTRYEFFPPKGLRVNRIANLHNDLMLATQSTTVNILAPVPGRNTVGVELENATKSPVYLRELLQSDAFKNPKLRIPVALGKNVYGTPVIGDLAAMPHTLVAGTTGSGKSVCINSMILSMLYKFRPDELRLILVDPKVVEMQPYRKLPHLACPVVTEPARVIGALRWAVNEMEHRYRMFSKMGVRNFEDFNNRPEDYIPEPEEEEMPMDYAPLPDGISAADAIIRDIEDSQGVGLGEEEQDELDFEAEEKIPARLPYIVIIIDELADLMQTVKEDLENYIARLTQKARAAGIHLVVATQTPRAQVLTGTIKANIPCRIALKVSSPLDSRIILDTSGAENLLGKGDLLFLPPGGITKLCRAQGAWVSDAEIASIIKFCASQTKQDFVQGVTSEMNNAGSSPGSMDNGGRLGGKGVSDEDAELYTRCVNLVVTERKASTSLLQRRFSIGYGRAAKMMDMMEKRGVIGPSQGASRPREILVDAP